MDTHITAAAGYYYMVTCMHHLRYGHAKPRLQHHRHSLAVQVARDGPCQVLTRLTPTELKQLCRDLLINANPRAQLTRNWCFNGVQRAAAALSLLAAPITARRARQAFGWAANSLGANMEDFVQQVLLHLDTDDSSELLITDPRPSL
jgi:hypothetical protein